MMQSNVAQLYNCTYMFYLILKKFQKIETKKDTLSHWRSSYNNHGQMYTLGSHRIGKRLQGPKLRLVFKKMLSFFNSSVKWYFSERGIFKGLQEEFNQQLEIVVDHYYQSDDTKFNSNYVSKQMKSLLNVHISERQCRSYLSRVHHMITPSTRALIKFKCRQKRLEVSWLS